MTSPEAVGGAHTSPASHVPGRHRRRRRPHRRADLGGVTPKPPILWLRGADDVIVSDTSFFDLAFLGSLGAVPGWPGEKTHPPQPMLAQTRAVLATYAAAGGEVTETVIADAGHSPHLEQPEAFGAALHAHLAHLAHLDAAAEA